ncbi:MAG: carotenoid 1,2-hydratase, partial [Bacteroidales bacterium]|nr:carotenoid 1,2-hydratase [Bacteroidales bacterium]
MKELAICTYLLFLSFSASSQAWKVYPFIPDESLISFPDDEGKHSLEPIEWWYTSGHLTGESSGKHYSYMLSYFRSPQFGFDGFRIFNFSDDDIGLIHYDTKPLYFTLNTTDSLNIEANIFMGGTETWHNKTDAGGKALPFEYKLTAESSLAELDLEYDALKPPLILADSGFLYQGSDDYTYYYSQTRNAVSGTITFNGVSENVSGTSWIDRQYGIFNPANGQEYEWFSAQLSNGMDLNIYNIFSDSYKIPDTLTFRILAAYVDDNTQYTSSNFEIERLEYSYTTDEQRCYSQKWRLTSIINDIDIIISSLHPDYEVQLPFRFYEGSTNITGTVMGENVTGIGFTELLHSYEIPDIKIADTTNLDDASTLLSWQLNNPDDGNPIEYDLEYSIDNQQSFSPLVQHIADTFYYWDTQALSNEEIWLKVTGYSIDKTIINSRIEHLVSNVTSIDNIEEQKLFNIYPNPSDGIFTVEGKNIQ